MSLLAWERLGSPGRSWRVSLGRRKSGFLTSDKRVKMDGWSEYYLKIVISHVVDTLYLHVAILRSSFQLNLFQNLQITREERQSNEAINDEFHVSETAQNTKKKKRERSNVKKNNILIKLRLF